MTADRFIDQQSHEAYQLLELQDLISAVLQSNPFYQHKLRTAGILSPPASLTSWFTSGFFTTKDELGKDQQLHPPYGTNLTYPPERYTRCHQTSGSSGTPLRWLDTPESWDWMLYRWETVFQEAGVTHNDRIFFAFSFGPFLGFWTAFEAGLRLGARCLPGGGLGTAARLRSLIDNQATALCCTPTYAIHLGEAAATHGFPTSALSHIQRIIVAGEPGGSIPATRHRIESLWPAAQVIDHHGMTEIGPVTYQCPRSPGILHVMENAYIAEIIDPATLQHVTPGDRGELVLTNLGRTGSPLLRYRTGDTVCTRKTPAEASPALHLHLHLHSHSHSQSPAQSNLSKPGVGRCECGTLDLALMGGILGRMDDMVVVRGVNIYPSAVESVLRSIDGVGEYQVQVRTGLGAMTQLRVEVEPSPSLGKMGLDPFKARVISALEQAFSMRFEVGLVEAGSLPRHELKSRRWHKEQIL